MRAIFIDSASNRSMRGAFRSLMIVACAALLAAALPARANAISYQGLWWASPPGSESGWGINFTHQGDIVFATWFTYDGDGNPLWYGAVLQRANGSTTYSGDLFRTTGPAFNAASFDPAAVTEVLAGSASVGFADATTATFNYTVGGVTRSKTIVPQVFRSPPTCRFGARSSLDVAANYTGLWWAAPAGSESGWGINFAHQENLLFATWFTYDAQGKPQWLVATFERFAYFWVGDVYRVTGPSFNASAFDSAAVRETKVGNALLYLGYENNRASGNAGRLDYTINGHSGSKQLTQQIFADPVTLCTQVYTPASAQAAFSASGASDLDAAIDFANRRSLSAFHVDYLTNSTPGTTIRYLREHQKPDMWGGALIEGYTLGFDAMIVTSADPAQVAYPADYSPSRAQNVAIADPYCDPAPATIAFPAAYLGTRPLPAISVTPGRGDFRRIAHLKDVWGKPNPNFVPGCRGDPRDAAKATLDRLARLGFDTIFVTPWTNFDTSVTPWRILNPAEARSSIIGDDDLEWLVKEAKGRGFAVYWRNQIQGAQMANGNYLPLPQPTVANVLASYDALETYLEERGAFLQRIGVDGVSIGPWYWTGFSQVLDEATYLDRTRRMIQRLKTSFTGKISYDEPSAAVASDPYLSTAIDFIEAGPFAGNLTAEEVANLTFEGLKQRLRVSVQGLNGSIAGKPVFWSVQLASRTDVFTTGYLEETFCSAAYNQVIGYDAACIQQDKQTDFGLQAMWFEAAFEAIFETAGSTVRGLVVPYWMDDNLLPSTTFPNLATSIRSKPAEAIVYQWFRP